MSTTVPTRTRCQRGCLRDHGYGVLQGSQWPRDDEAHVVLRPGFGRFWCSPTTQGRRRACLHTTHLSPDRIRDRRYSGTLSATTASEAPLATTITRRLFAPRYTVCLACSSCDDAGSHMYYMQYLIFHYRFSIRHDTLNHMLCRVSHASCLKVAQDVCVCVCVWLHHAAGLSISCVLPLTLYTAAQDCSRVLQRQR